MSAMALLFVQGCGAAKAREEPATVPGLEVALDSGMIRGVDDGDVLRYRGIRYARPPVGELRWRPPEPVARWRGVVPATASGPACPQDNVNQKERSDAEDCLTLDVTVPKKAGAKRKPVMVWLPGGGFVAGRGADYDQECGSACLSALDLGKVVEPGVLAGERALNHSTRRT